MSTTVVNLKVCRLCGASYSTSSGSYFSSRHFLNQHPGETPQWRTRRETREAPMTITYMHGEK